MRVADDDILISGGNGIARCNGEYEASLEVVTDGTTRCIVAFA
jgi:hypothetical protein